VGIRWQSSWQGRHVNHLSLEDALQHKSIRWLPLDVYTWALCRVMCVIWPIYMCDMTHLHPIRHLTLDNAPQNQKKTKKTQKHLMTSTRCLHLDCLSSNVRHTTHLYVWHDSSTSHAPRDVGYRNTPTSKKKSIRLLPLDVCTWAPGCCGDDCLALCVFPRETRGWGMCEM